MQKDLMMTKHSEYPLDQSPLYKLSNKRKMASLFNMSLKKIQRLIDNQNNFYTFTAGKNNKKRIIENPKPQLSCLHKRFFQLLCRIKPPDYLQSFKGCSYVTNSAKHVGDNSIIKLDIASFFPSTADYHIYDFFYNVLKCSTDVSAILTKICTVNKHLPTGSSLSQILAFYAHISMFNSIAQLAKQHNLTMTLYVDDIVISGKTSARKSLMNQVRILIKQRGLNSKRQKEKIYHPNQIKLVTGVIVAETGIRVRNKVHKEIFDGINTFNNNPDKTNLSYLSASKSLLGKMTAASQIDSTFSKKAKKFKKKLTQQAMSLT